MSQNHLSQSSNTTSRSSRSHQKPKCVRIEDVVEILVHLSISEEEPLVEGQLGVLKRNARTLISGLREESLMQYFLEVGKDYQKKILDKPGAFHNVIDRLASEGHEDLLDQFLKFIPPKWELEDGATDSGEKEIYVKVPGGDFELFGIVQKT